MNKLLACLVIVGTMGAITKKQAPISIIDRESPLPQFSLGPDWAVHPLNVTVLRTDSSRNEYTNWTNIQDPVYVSPDGQYVITIFRGYEPDHTGMIAGYWSNNGGATFYHARRINQAAGTLDAGGRYPTGVVHAGLPVASFPELTAGPAWGYATELTGAWSNNNADWYGERSSDLDIHKALAFPIGNTGNVMLLAATEAAGTWYGIYDVVGGFFLTPPAQLDASFTLDGGDFWGDYVYAFGFHTGIQSLAYYRYSIATGTWSGPHALQNPPVETLPNGEVLNTVFWSDGAVMNDGTPFMVVDVMDGSGVDTVDASRSIWFVTPTTSRRIYSPSTGYTDHVIYSQAAVDRQTGTIYCFFLKLGTAWGDTRGYGPWELYYTASTNNGTTWTTPQNLSNTPTVDEALAHFSKRVVNGTAYVVYMRAMTGQLDLYWNIVSNGTPAPAYYYLARITGLTVQENENKSSTVARIEGRNLRLVLRDNENASITVYNSLGQKIAEKSVVGNNSEISLPINTTFNLNSGIYFIHVKTLNSSTTFKFTNF